MRPSLSLSYPQTEVVQLKQTATESKSELMSKEANIKQLEIQNQQRLQDIQDLRGSLRKVTYLDQNSPFQLG